MQNTNEKPVIVVGGGLGGLAFAAALGLKGRKVMVMEQASEIAPIGYGIQLGPNIFRVFDQLGITEKVMALTDFPDALVMRDAETGEVLLPVDLKSARFKERFERPYVVIHRGDIHDVLLNACKEIPTVELVTSATVTGYEQDASGVTVTCEDGRIFSGSAIIGADGIRSRIRGSIVGEERATPIGYVAHRTILPMSETPLGYNLNDVVCWAGPTYHVVHYPLRHGNLFNIVAVFKTDSLDATPGNPTYRSVLDEAFSGAHPDLQKIIAKMDVQQRWVLADRPPVRNWSNGLVTLLGDAAHPTLQSYAQGACMALEDAAILANLLEKSGYEYPRTFLEYQKRRLARTARVQLGSRSMWDFYHCDGIARDVRDYDICNRKQDDTYNCLAWLWDGVPLN